MGIDRAALASYFRQLAELGVDEISLDGMSAEEAVAALGRSGARPQSAARTAPPQSAPRAAPPQTVAVESAPRRSSAAGPAVPVGALAPTALPVLPRRARDAGALTAATARLEALSDTAAGCSLCRLHAERSTVVFGEGNAAADLVVVGEAPGQEEDRTGRPFVGRAGRLLDLMLMAVGFPRADVYICNVLKCRPPNNRNPLPDEVSACTTNLLHGQLEAIAPRVLLAVGKFAAQSLLGSDEAIGRLRGMVHNYRGTPLIVTYHPAYLLRSPQMTRVAWHDFQLIRRVLDEQA